MADAPDLGSGGVTRVGSNPIICTTLVGNKVINMKGD